jgi:hypothetical protein
MAQQNSQGCIGGSGGGGGGISIKNSTVYITSQTTFTYTVGNGGSFGNLSNGTNGSASLFSDGLSTSLNANGGNGGTYNATIFSPGSTTFNTGGAGGSSSGGDINGTYYKISTVNSSLSAGSFNLGGGLILEAGEKISCSIGTSGVNILLKGFLFDSSIPFYSPRLVPTQASTSIKLYTAPSTTIGGSSLLLTSGVVIRAANGTGGTISYHAHIKPNGGSMIPISSAAGTSIASNVLSTVGSTTYLLNGGDELYVMTSVDTPGQFIWTSVLELPY